MKTSNNMSSSQPFAILLKVVVAVAVIAFVAVAAVRPELVNGRSGEAQASAASPAPASITSVAARTSDTDYFPSRFDAPKGDVATVPATF